MKRFITTTIITSIFLMLGAVNGFAQSSDYQIKINFEEAHTELKSSIENAVTVDEIDSISAEIQSFESKYEKHASLLDNALYPGSFDSRISELKKQSRNTEHKLLIIETQNDKLAQLNKELTSYKSEVSNLTSKTDSLRNIIQYSEKSERELSGIVQRYRKSLEERDAFVLNMIDSLFASYKDLQPEEISELTEGNETRMVKDTKDNPLEFIQSVIEQNTQIIKSGQGSLGTEDYLRMYVIQNRFTEVWSQIGSDLVTIYGGSQKAQWKASIENKLHDWRATTSKNMWASIDEYLDEKNINLGAFDNNESFYNAIDSFVKRATDSSRERVITTENYEDFQAFYDFWNGKIKSEWGTFVQEGEVLTMSQISAIDSEIMNWRDESKPRSFVIPILFGLSLLTIVGLIIAIARKP